MTELHVSEQYDESTELTTGEETAEAVGVSPATVKRQWTMARAWLKLQLESA